MPELEITARQYGWSGERVPGFLGRMTNDCLRFHPNVATTCYGMNDHEYRIYEERIGKTYREKSEAMVQAFKANGVRLVLGSPGCVGKVPGWVKGTNGTVEDLNQIRQGEGIEGPRSRLREGRRVHLPQRALSVLRHE